MFLPVLSPLDLEIMTHPLQLCLALSLIQTLKTLGQVKENDIIITIIIVIRSHIYNKNCPQIEQNSQHCQTHIISIHLHAFTVHAKQWSYLRPGSEHQREPKWHPFQTSDDLQESRKVKHNTRYQAHKLMRRGC